MKTLLLILILSGLLCGCGCPEPVVPTTEPAATVLTAPVTEPPAEPTAISAELEAAAMIQAPAPATAFVPEAEPSGILEMRCDSACIDYSHAEEGYVMALYTGQTDRRLKVLVKGPATTYSYNLSTGQWAVFPLSDGSGSYQIGIYENVTGSKYATVLNASMEVTLLDEFAPFLRPNQYVDYTAATNAVALAAELTAGIDDPLKKVETVYDYVIATLSYDYEKAATVTSGYLPVLDEVLESRQGICFDYAALMTAMLRSQQIPCKLVVGYAGDIYHAWISVWTEENGWIDGIIFFDGKVWNRMDPTFASSADGDPEILDFIENGTYTVKYLY